jgi:hypothetical protein
MLSSSKKRLPPQSYGCPPSSTFILMQNVWGNCQMSKAIGILAGRERVRIEVIVTVWFQGRICLFCCTSDTGVAFLHNRIVVMKHEKLPRI